MHSTLVNLSTHAAGRQRWIAGAGVVVLAALALIFGDANSIGTVNY